VSIGAWRGHVLFTDGGGGEVRDGGDMRGERGDGVPVERSVGVRGGGVAGGTPSAACACTDRRGSGRGRGRSQCEGDRPFTRQIPGKWDKYMKLLHSWSESAKKKV
jgi:hypothetical protein